MLLSRNPRWVLGVCSLMLGTLIGCVPSRIDTWDDSGSDGGGGGPSPGSPDMPPGRGPLCGPSMPCPSGQVCYQNACVPSLGDCCNDDECENDSHCTVQTQDGSGACGSCVAYNPGEYDPTCMGNGFSAYDFQSPTIRCQWPAMGSTPMAADVIMTPIVVDLDLDGKPEIVFAPQNGTGPMRLVAMHGNDCTVLYDVTANLQGFSQIAAADLDGDKYPEIVGLLQNGMAAGGHPLAVFDGRTGTQLAQSSASVMMTGASFDCSGIALGDLNGDGVADIVSGGLAVTWNKAAGTLDTLWNVSVQGATWGTVSLINDMDGDGFPEVISGNQIFDGRTGADKTPSKMKGMLAGSYAAIGDFNNDKSPDVVLIQSASGNEQVAVMDVKNNAWLMAPTSVPNGWGGPPTVADFDGDGIPDFGSAGPRNYTVFSLDCLKTPKPAKCTGSFPGVLWQSNTKDVSSGGTASSVFDFNGDGRAEVVYRDECWLRVYDGPDGKTLFAQSITSGTALELPVIADVDNDGHADIVVPSDSIQGNGYCADQNPEQSTGQPHLGVTQGIFVLEDPMNRWMPSRPLWNEHSYHITNVNDDESLPKTEPPNWTKYNNYRQNVQGSLSISIPQSDVTSKGAPPLDQTNCSMQWTLNAQVCSRGDASISAKIPGTFYPTDPRMDDSMPICTAWTTGSIAPGACQTVSCNWANPPATPVDLWFRPDDDGKGAHPQPECKNDNNLAHLPGAMCQSGPG